MRTRTVTSRGGFVVTDEYAAQTRMAGDELARMTREAAIGAADRSPYEGPFADERAHLHGYLAHPDGAEVTWEYDLLRMLTRFRVDVPVVMVVQSPLEDLADLPALVRMRAENRLTELAWRIRTGER